MSALSFRLWWCLHNMAQLEQLNIEDNRQITGKVSK